LKILHLDEFDLLSVKFVDILQTNFGLETLF
jgi:hypothetical protein